MGEDDYSWLSDLFGGGGGSSSPDDYSWLTGALGDGTNYDQWQVDNPQFSGGAGGDYGWGSNGSGGFSLGDLLKSALGGGKSGAGGLGALGGLLPYLLSGAGAYMGVKANNKANNTMQAATKEANDMIRGMYDKNAAGWEPWQKLGVDTMAKVQAMPDSNLAARYKPLGSGVYLSALAKGK